MSYCLCNCVLLFVQLCLTIVQLCLTTCATVSYYLCKWLARSFPIYGNGFRGCTSENQGLHKKLSNSKIGLHTDLGNSRTEKASLKQELVELWSQLETKRADRDRCRTFWLKRENCIGFGKNKKSAPIAIGVEVRSQLETERADREKTEAELLPAKAKFCSGRHTFGKINTRRGNHS